MAVFAVLPEFSRFRRATIETWSHRDVGSDSQVVPQMWPTLCQSATSPSTSPLSILAIAAFGIFAAMAWQGSAPLCVGRRIPRWASGSKSSFISLPLVPKPLSSNSRSFSREPPREWECHAASLPYNYHAATVGLPRRGYEAENFWVDINFDPASHRNNHQRQKDVVPFGTRGVRLSHPSYSSYTNCR